MCNLSPRHPTAICEDSSLDTEVVKLLTGMFCWPNSAPDSLTPKNWNLVKFPEQPAALVEAGGAEEVVVADVGVVDVAEVVAVPGRH